MIRDFSSARVYEGGHALCRMINDNLNWDACRHRRFKKDEIVWDIGGKPHKTI